MFVGKKGQGLPINTIILIAIGLLILVLFITFVLGGFKGLGAGTTGGSGLSAFYSQCNTLCTNDAAANSYPSDWCSSTSVYNSATYNCYNQTGLSGQVTCTTYNGSKVGAPPTPGAAGTWKNCP